VSYIVNGKEEHNLYVEIKQGFLTLRKRGNPRFKIEVHFSRDELLELLGRDSKQYEMETRSKTAYDKRLSYDDDTEFDDIDKLECAGIYDQLVKE